MSRDDLEQLRQIIREEVRPIIEGEAEVLQKLDQRLGRIEENQKTMIGTLSELRDAYREQQTKLLNHERRIDRLERGDQNYFLNLQVH